MASDMSPVADNRESGIRSLLLQVGITSVVLTELVGDGISGLVRQHLEEVDI